MKSKVKSFLFFSLRILVSLLLIFFLFSKIPFSNIFEIFKSASIPLITLAFAVLVAVHFLGIKRWEILIRSCGFNTDFLHLSFPFFSGLFFNLFFPSTLAGDFFRTVLLFGGKRSSPHILASVFLDRFSGFLALSSIGMVSLLLNPELLKNKDIVLVVASFFILITTSLFFLSRPYLFNFLERIAPSRFKAKVSSVKEAFKFFKDHRLVFWQSLACSFFIQLGSVSVTFFILLSLGQSVPFIKMAGLICVVNLISMLPISIAGLGTRDVSSVYFLGILGVVKEIAFSSSLLVFFFFSVMGLLGGVIYAAFYSRWIQYNKHLVSLEDR